MAQEDSNALKHGKSGDNFLSARLFLGLAWEPKTKTC
jgi:hypothetical protein